MVLPQEIVRAKRDGRTLDDATIRAFVRGITDGSVTESQASAFAMAVFFQGMSLDERVSLTLAMRDSGRVMEWRSLGLSGPVIDKHSTGGVGDKVSLILAPILAACGGFVPMVSGRGLGHTGGTLDKFEAIPGYQAKPDSELLRRVVKEAGCAVIGATDDIAPADRRLYAIRDVTATVESLDLITASILSKKLAAGLDALVMDVKFGSGAFMQRFEDAEALADSIVTVAEGAGLPAVALLTDMNEVLGHSAGNSLEMRECLAILRGGPAEPRLCEVTVALAGELLARCGLASCAAAGRAMADRAVGSGAAAERFARMVRSLGGPSDLLERPDAHLERAPVVRPIFAERTGWVAAVDTRAVGMAVVALGGGRTKVTDAIDFAVGFDAVAGLGAEAGPDRPLAFVHARTEAQADEAAERVRRAFTIGDAAPVRGPLIAKRVGG
ncbi:thymidine phosphorylase [Azospirillum doebereinerae]|uniref:thymidine phosphorylase n=1 Tax=Azospirillum doebereinerae TaxID=92933 RepID=UPI00384E494A